MAKLREWFNHTLLVSVAFTETGGVHTLRLRSAWIVCACVFMLSGWLGMVVAGDFAAARLKAHITGNAEMAYYIDVISQLKAERDAQQQQVRLIAQEMGVLQARLDRFDALGAKLKAEGTLLSEAPAKGGDTDGDGKGGPEDLKGPLPSMDDVRKQLGLLTTHADDAEIALETSLAMAIRKAMGPTNEGLPYLWPLMMPTFRYSSSFGWRVDPFHNTKAWHAGMDLASPIGSPVIAAGDGVVTYAGWRFGYGFLVEIKHAQGFSTRYGHLSKTIAREGQKVKAGDLVALLGNTGRSTGAHLHFEVRRDEVALNPVPFIKDTKDDVLAQAAKGRGTQLLAAWNKTQTKKVAKK
ncbi:MAG TPA: M23 family metallopeptidase [Alphaproteobacteria bacterium]|nr:M23 family metallopeptidase [Alphaproteobacteria bacterium]